MPKSRLLHVPRRGKSRLVMSGVLVLVACLSIRWTGADQPAPSASSPPAKADRAQDRQPPATQNAVPPKPGADAPLRFRRFWTAVLEFRGKCAKAGTPGWKQFAAAPIQQRLDSLNREIWGEVNADEGWASFFSLTLFELGHPYSKNPLVGFYHPWSDVWVLTQWEVDPAPKIVDMELLLGEWVRRRGKPPFDARPDWLRREGFLPEQLARATLDNIKDFDRLMSEGKPWWQSLQLREQETLHRKINHTGASIRLVTALLRAGELTTGDKEQPVLEQLVAARKAFLQAGQEGKIAGLLESAKLTEPGIAKVVRGLPSRVFGVLEPAYWLADEKRAAVFLVPRTNPDFCLALTYERDPGAVRLVRVDILDFPSMFAAMQKKEAK